jgi:hypothetical protein
MRPSLAIYPYLAKSLAFAAGLLCGGVAVADPGDHIRLGDAEVVPSVGLRAVRRSNLYLGEGLSVDAEGVQVGSEEVAGSAIHVLPSIAVNLDGEATSLRFNFDYRAVDYLSDEHQNPDRFKDFETGLILNALKDSLVGLKVNQRFHITGRETEAVYATSAYINHLMNSSSARISLRPGSSLEIDVGGNYNFDKYDISGDPSELGSPALNSRTAYGPGVDLRWAFFPKTAIVGSYSKTWFSWKNNLVDTKGDGISIDEFGETLGIPDGSEWRATLGLRGRVTEKIVVGLIGGYGEMIYDEGSVPGQGQPTDGYGKDLKGFPGGLLSIVEVGYNATDSQLVTLGYRKSFQDVYFTNYVDFHNVFFRYDGRFADKVGVKADAGYRFEQYVGEVNRDDHFVNLGLALSYMATEFLDVGTAVKWQQRGSADGAHGDAEYDDITVSMGLTATY